MKSVSNMCIRFIHRQIGAFTMVEMMIVVAIIGLLSVLSMPALAKARRHSRVAAFCHDLRTASDAFLRYAADYGTYPPDSTPGVAPVGMAGYFEHFDWTKPTPLGGQWDWERNAVGVSAGISCVTVDTPEFQDVDDMIDDGNLATGKFYRNSGRYTYVLEP